MCVLFSIDYVFVSHHLQRAKWLHADGGHPGHDLILLKAALLYRYLLGALPAGEGFPVSGPMYEPNAKFADPSPVSRELDAQESLAYTYSTSRVAGVLATLADDSSASSCIAKGEFKGVELYSWRGAENRWQFALVPGTNREKSEQEVKSEAACIHTLPQVRRILSELDGKDEVFWIERRSMRFELPSPTTVANVSAAATSGGSQLHVVREPQATDERQ